jgi:hypothetical protein
LGDPRIEQGEDVRVLQVGGGLDLGEEPLGADHGGQLGPEHLDRDLAVVLQVVGEVHRGHATRAQLAVEAVAVGEGGGERGGYVAHARRLKPARPRTRGGRSAAPALIMLKGVWGEEAARAWAAIVTVRRKVQDPATARQTTASLVAQQGD